MNTSLENADRSDKGDTARDRESPRGLVIENRHGSLATCHNESCRLPQVPAQIFTGPAERPACSFDRLEVSRVGEPDRVAQPRGLDHGPELTVQGCTSTDLVAHLDCPQDRACIATLKKVEAARTGECRQRAGVEDVLPLTQEPCPPASRPT